MLELKRITKIYKTGNLKQKALDDVSLCFRKSEFAAILGPSGSGKTTLLNIVGGLDNYTSGDLIINGISTKEYKDSSWDSYRNHRIGFVFQSYNLISHQTVLQNVVLALTLSGISKKEGIKRAKKVLNEVGLSDHIYKKPNQLSGGQMQRVAIARALVNDPDILLADEPTGALDSETSVQIMNLLKKIASDKLVIMVTHNPELANEYSNRIIQLKDGKVTSDTNPYTEGEVEEESVNKTKKTTMSYLTALSLSFNNLMTKKGRTILVSLAGSIGIIGIALILALSTGFQNYIDKIQEDTLSSYPLTITDENADMTSMLLSMVGEQNKDEDLGDKIIEKQYVTSMFSSISNNDLRSFKKHIEENYSEIKDDITTIKYSYSVNPLIYTKTDGKLNRLNPSTLFSSFYTTSAMNTIYASYTSVFTQMINDKEILTEQYDVLAGKWPEKYDEMVVVLSEKNGISDMLVYFLGLRDMDELTDMINKMMAGEIVNINNEPMELTYDDLMNIDLRLINQTDTYKYNSKYNIYEDMSEDDTYMKNLYDKALKLKIVGFVCPKKGNTSMAINPGVAYTEGLIDYIINNSSTTTIVKKQLANKDTDVFSNTSFDEKEKKESLDFEDLISVDKEMLSSAFNMDIDENTIKNLTNNYMSEISKSITADTNPAYNDYKNNLSSLAKKLINDYIANPKETAPNPMLPSSTVAVIHTNSVDAIVNDFFSKSDSKNALSQLESKYVVPSSYFENSYKSLISNLLKGYINVYNQNDQSFTVDSNNPGAMLMSGMTDGLVDEFLNQEMIDTVCLSMAKAMTEAKMQKEILTKVGGLTGELMSKIASSFNVDPNKIAGAFKFDLTEDELKRIMTVMMGGNKKSNAKSNLVSLGYQDKDEPTSISFYFKSFDSKENFLKFIEDYNDIQKKNNDEDKVIRYTDATGILMGSVKKVVNSVSYVLIAFVSISLVVSSIMIGIITYISVLERTKEIGILRAIGASKRNVSSIFSAETFIIGLLSGLFGIGITLILIPIINSVIHSLTENNNISATIPFVSSILLIVLSIILTLIGGLIPSKKASKQDPVVALRTE